MIKEIIHTHITECLERLELSFEKEFSVETPNNTEHGDYSNKTAQ
jgi:arginyl-tRNA synthetase